LETGAVPTEAAEERNPPERRVDLPRIERAVREILVAAGEDPDREGLKGTPGRVARAYESQFVGLREEPVRHLRVGFQEDHREMVLLRDIPPHPGGGHGPHRRPPLEPRATSNFAPYIGTK
jgi:GTP cyclohydrolase I